MKKVFLCLISVFVLASLCVAMAVPAMAATYSAEGEEVFQINVSSFAEGSKSSGNYKVEDDGTITLTVSKDSDYNIVKWAIDGEYEIVSGSLTSKTLVILKSFIPVVSFPSENVPAPPSPNCTLLLSQNFASSQNFCTLRLRS